MVCNKLSILRIYLSIIFFIICEYYFQTSQLSLSTKIGIILMCIFILDQIDCLSFLFPCNCRTFNYQKKDKLLDIYTYIYVLIIFSNLFTSNTLILLWVFVLWRLIGVYKFYHTNENTHIHYHFDAINITIFVYFISLYFNITNDMQYSLLLIAGVIFKIIWEQKHHSTPYPNSTICPHCNQSSI